MDDGGGDADGEARRDLRDNEEWNHGIFRLIGYKKRNRGFYDFLIFCLSNWRAICCIHREKVHRKKISVGEKIINSILNMVTF